MNYTQAELQTELMKRLTDEALQFIVDKGAGNNQTYSQLFAEFIEKYKKSPFLSGYLPK